MDGLAISGRLGAQASEWIPDANIQLVDARSTLDCETAPSGKMLLTPSRTNFTLGVRFFGVGVQIFGALPASSGSGGVSFIMDGVASSQVVFTGSTASGCESHLMAQMRTPEQGHHLVTITPQAVPVEVAFYSALVWNPPPPTSTSGGTVAATSPASDTPSPSSTSAPAEGAPPDTSPSDSQTASSPSSVSSGSSPSSSSTKTNGASSSTVQSATTGPGPGTATSTVTLATTANTVTMSDYTSGTVSAGVIVAAVLIPLLLLLLLWLAFILRKRRRRKAVLVTPLQVGAEASTDSDSNHIADATPSRSTEKGRMSVTPTHDESAGAAESELGTARDASTMDADSNTEGAALVRAARRAGFTTETLLHSLNRVHKGGYDTDAEWEPPMYH